MYKYSKTKPTTLRLNNSYEGERIEERVEKIMNTKEPITDGAPAIYTERRDGVKPEYDIRTDKWDLATDAMDKVHQQAYTKREERIKKAMEEGKEAIAKAEGGGDGKAESVQATNPENGK